MWWLIIPIFAFVVILCIIVQDHYNAQMDKIRRDERERKGLTLYNEDSDESSIIECETSDEPIYRRNNDRQNQY